MKPALVAVAGVALALALAPACGSGFPSIGSGSKLVVTVTEGDVGSPARFLPVSTAAPTSFTIRIEAQNADGSTDTSFNNFVNVSIEPGTVEDLSVRNVKLSNGTVDDVVVPVVGVFGAAHIWAQDLGYEPAAPNRVPPPQCSDGIDNNHNGLIDYPADPGCYAPVDDSEDGGTYAAGVSEALYFDLPRIALVRGYNPAAGTTLGNATAFPQQQISIDTGWRGSTSYAFSTVVIGLTASGFYVQNLQNDIGSAAPGFGGLFAYNYSTPPFMRVCDRVQILSGTTSDFYGFTELNYPTWQLEYWDQTLRPCLVPEPTTLGIGDMNSLDRLWQLEATLVRTQTAGTNSVHVAKHFGPADVPLVMVNGTPTYVPTDTATNCDFDHSGKIDFTDAAESACAAVCAGGCSAAPTDFECSEWSAYESETDFDFVAIDYPNVACTMPSDCPSDTACAAVGLCVGPGYSPTPCAASGTPCPDGTLCTTGTTPPPAGYTTQQCVGQSRIQATAAAADLFNPVTSRGQTIGSFTGLLSYFSGGCQFTMQARCQDDVVPDVNSPPLPSNVACVHPRTQSDLNDNSQ